MGLPVPKTGKFTSWTYEGDIVAAQEWLPFAVGVLNGCGSRAVATSTVTPKEGVRIRVDAITGRIHIAADTSGYATYYYTESGAPSWRTDGVVYIGNKPIFSSITTQSLIGKIKNSSVNIYDMGNNRVFSSKSENNGGLVLFSPFSGRRDFYCKNIGVSKNCYGELGIIDAVSLSGGCFVLSYGNDFYDINIKKIYLEKFTPTSNKIVLELSWKYPTNEIYVDIDHYQLGISRLYIFQLGDIVNTGRVNIMRCGFSPDGKILTILGSLNLTSNSRGCLEPDCLTAQSTPSYIFVDTILKLDSYGISVNSTGIISVVSDSVNEYSGNKTDYESAINSDNSIVAHAFKSSTGVERVDSFTIPPDWTIGSAPFGSLLNMTNTEYYGVGGYVPEQLIPQTVVYTSMVLRRGSLESDFLALVTPGHTITGSIFNYPIPETGSTFNEICFTSCDLSYTVEGGAGTHYINIIVTPYYVYHHNVVGEYQEEISLVNDGDFVSGVLYRKTKYNNGMYKRSWITVKPKLINNLLAELTTNIVAKENFNHDICRYVGGYDTAENLDIAYGTFNAGTSRIRTEFINAAIVYQYYIDSVLIGRKFSFDENGTFIDYNMARQTKITYKYNGYASNTNQRTGVFNQYSLLNKYTLSKQEINYISNPYRISGNTCSGEVRPFNDISFSIKTVNNRWNNKVFALYPPGSGILSGSPSIMETTYVKESDFIGEVIINNTNTGIEKNRLFTSTRTVNNAIPNTSTMQQPISGDLGKPISMVSVHYGIVGTPNDWIPDQTFLTRKHWISTPDVLPPSVNDVNNIQFSKNDYFSLVKYDTKVGSGFISGGSRIDFIANGGKIYNLINIPLTGYSGDRDIGIGYGV
jgi:hypothetical protein